jgi:hypothetical protein
MKQLLIISCLILSIIACTKQPVITPNKSTNPPTNSSPIVGIWIYTGEQYGPGPIFGKYIDETDSIKYVSKVGWKFYNDGTYKYCSWKINEVVTETNGTLILSGIYSVKNNILYTDGGITCVCGGDTIKSLTSNTMQLQSYNLNYLTKQ